MQASLLTATDRAEGLAEGLKQEREQSAVLRGGLSRERARTHDLQVRAQLLYHSMHGFVLLAVSLSFTELSFIKFLLLVSSWTVSMWRRRGWRMRWSAQTHLRRT